MSILDILVAGIEFFIANPISILTIFVPCILGIILLAFVFDFIIYYLAIKECFSDDDKEDKKDD